MENESAGNNNQENRDFQNEKTPLNQDNSPVNNLDGSEESSNDYGRENQFRTSDSTTQTTNKQESDSENRGDSGNSVFNADRRTEEDDLLEEEREYNSENLDDESDDEYLNESDSDDEMEDRSVKKNKLDPHFGGDFGF